MGELGFRLAMAATVTPSIRCGTGDLRISSATGDVPAFVTDAAQRWASDNGMAPPRGSIARDATTGETLVTSLTMPEYFRLETVLARALASHGYRQVRTEASATARTTETKVWSDGTGAMLQPRAVPQAPARAAQQQQQQRAAPRPCVAPRAASVLPDVEAPPAGWACATQHVDLRDERTVFALNVREECDAFVGVQLLGGPSAHFGTRLCVVEEQEPYRPVGGSSDTFQVRGTNHTSLLRLAPGAYLVMLEVFEQHVGRLPTPVAVTACTEAAGSSLSLFHGSVPWAFVLPEHADKNGRCSGCEGPISGAFVRVRNQQYHSYCLKCYRCGNNVGEKIYFVADKLHCAACASTPF